MGAATASAVAQVASIAANAEVSAEQVVLATSSAAKEAASSVYPYSVETVLELACGATRNSITFKKQPKPRKKAKKRTRLAEFEFTVLQRLLFPEFWDKMIRKYIEDKFSFLQLSGILSAEAESELLQKGPGYYSDPLPITHTNQVDPADQPRLFALLNSSPHLPRSSHYLVLNAWCLHFIEVTENKTPTVLGLQIVAGQPVVASKSKKQKTTATKAQDSVKEVEARKQVEETNKRLDRSSEEYLEFFSKLVDDAREKGAAYYDELLG
jgi:hypothetical protein